MPAAFFIAGVVMAAAASPVPFRMTARTGSRKRRCGRRAGRTLKPELKAGRFQSQVAARTFSRRLCAKNVAIAAKRSRRTGITILARFNRTSIITYLTEAEIMWRAMFLAIGFFLMILGVECLGVEQVSLKMRGDPPPSTSMFDSEDKLGPQKTVNPPPWAPWSLLSTGAVICLYSFTIPRRVAGN